LHELAQDYPLAKTLRTYREALNNRTKLSIDIRTSLDYNKCVEGPTNPGPAVASSAHVGVLADAPGERRVDGVHELYVGDSNAYP
jgi:hypothetical protein